MAARRKRTAARPKKKNNNKAALWRVAVHEAGHAIVAHALGLRVGDMTIVPGVTVHGDGYAGFTGLAHDPNEVLRAIDEYYDLENDSDDREANTFFFLMKNMQVSFAGMVAEELFFDGADDSGLGPDYEAINSYAEVVCQPDPQEFEEMRLDAPPAATHEERLQLAQEKLKTLPKWEEDYFKDWIRHRTRKLLRNRRELVEALAGGLLVKGHLSAEEITQVITSAIVPRSTRQPRVRVPRTRQGRS